MKFKHGNREVSIVDPLDRVLVRLDRQAPISKGGIVAPYYDRTYRLTGKVVMVGSRYKGVVKVGDNVMYKETNGTRVGDIYTLFEPEKDFLAIIEKD